MKPIKYNDSGPAVEDIQRRLRVLGYKIGPEGASAAFLDNTLAAISSFQRMHGIEQTGCVGPRTWSTLVDSTFELGDRMLYLRMPYFHGADVTQLQRALDSLGFVTGGADGIFGINTERAVTEFQQNYDINPDGFVGNNTLRALLDLRHMWDGKEGTAHSAAQGSPREHYRALLDYYFDFQVEFQPDSLFHDGSTHSDQTSNPGVVAALRRIVRYANNLEDAARTNIAKENAATTTTTLVVRITTDSLPEESTGSSSADQQKMLHFTYQDDVAAFAATLAAEMVAIKQQTQTRAGTKSSPPQTDSVSASYELRVVIPLQQLQSGSQTSPPQALQLTAFRLLDALCLAVIS
ncbi:MAG: peptidoglycan-binding protein [Coriobacteriia bacterium]|nr:peptidoglycan-binding protein [Coriobacteriia bacterium]